ncbi:hypothetical protein C7405_111125 [Paraburkholderia caballeronis]|nr:hypothetical protein C7405_111125 [Paraburkholderia caballeronis]
MRREIGAPKPRRRYRAEAGPVVVSAGTRRRFRVALAGERGQGLPRARPADHVIAPICHGTNSFCP